MTFYEFCIFFLEQTPSTEIIVSLGTLFFLCIQIFWNQKNHVSNNLLSIVKLHTEFYPNYTRTLIEEGKMFKDSQKAKKYNLIEGSMSKTSYYNFWDTLMIFYKNKQINKNFAKEYFQNFIKETINRDLLIYRKVTNTLNQKSKLEVEGILFFIEEWKIILPKEFGGAII